MKIAYDSIGRMVPTMEDGDGAGPEPVRQQLPGDWEMGRKFLVSLR